MDDDLAYCLDRFIDDQGEYIEKRIEAINQEEDVKCRRLEEEKQDFERKKPPPKNNGSHHEDKALVDQFTRDLRDSTKDAVPKTIIDDQTLIDRLRAEISTKVGACANYLNRLRNLAQPLPNTTIFVQTCNEAMEHLRRPQELEENFTRLRIVSEQSDASDIIKNVQQWWKDCYGSTITDINRRNQKINPAVSENNFAILSATSRILDNAKKLIAARKIVHVEPPKLEIIRQFVRQLLLIDENNREKINADNLIDHLNTSETDTAIKYAETWLEKRDEVRNKKEEENPFITELENAKADFGRRRIAQEAKKLALAALLCRLAVGSSNGEQFDQQLKKTIDKQKKKNDKYVPVISGDIKEPEGQEVPIVIKLELDGTNIDKWAANVDGIQQRFAAGLCQAFLIPENKIRVENFDRDKGIIYLCVLPPFGKKVTDSLNGTALDAAVRIEAVRKCCTDFSANIESITLGEFGLKIEDKLMDPRWNKTYVWAHSNRDEGEHWATPIVQGGKPYFCPSGWRRFGVKVANDEKEFDARWRNWNVAYHGTAGENASKILTSGLRVSTSGCFYEVGVPRVYVSPSIEYSAHPRYAIPWKRTKNGQNYWYQLIFQCRVNPTSVDRVDKETLIKNEHKQSVTVDPNFNNDELEWIILGQTGDQYITEDIICYGLMMRVSSVDPITLPASAWWEYSLHTNTYQK